MPNSVAIMRQGQFESNRIDRDAGIIYGVKIAELGKVACFKGPDGKPRYATITDKHASAFLAHAGNRSIPVHWTHDYRSGESDNLHAMVGCLKAFRLDESGNPVADLHVAPSDKRDLIFWNAMENRENMMLSPVYGYDPRDSNSIPLSFDAADLVQRGAATVALFSEYDAQQKTNMDKQEFLSLLADPEVKAALCAASAGAAPDQAAIAAEIDKRVATAATNAVTAAMATAEASLLTRAEAALTAKIGAGNQALLNAGKPPTNDETPESFITAEMASMDVPRRDVAITIMATKKPSLYAKYVEGK
jgi:hypothetical protein